MHIGCDVFIAILLSLLAKGEEQRYPVPYL